MPKGVLNIYEPDPSGEETNEYAEYPDDNTVGFLLFKTEAISPIISMNSCSPK